VIGMSADCRGSILIYVLWILMLISTLAYQFTSSSRVAVLNQQAELQRQQQEMQLDSAVQFAIFKIRANQWLDIQHRFELNGEQFVVSILNEAGFISLYDFDTDLFTRLLQKLDISISIKESLRQWIKVDKVRFNHMDELIAIEGLDHESVSRLQPYLSLFHTGAVNLNYAPTDVLYLLPGLDHLRIEQLAEEQDIAERYRLREELASMATSTGISLNESESRYFRLVISVEDLHYRVFLKYQKKQRKYRLISVERISRGVADVVL